MDKKEIKKLLKARIEINKERNICEQYLQDNTLSDNISQIYQKANLYFDELLKDIDEQLLVWCQKSPVGMWLLQIKGITIDMAAGLITYFDIKDKHCAAQFIKFAGLDDYYGEHHQKEASVLMYRIKCSFRATPDSYYLKLSRDKFFDLIADQVEERSAHNKADGFMIRVFAAHLFEEMYREEHNGAVPERHNDDTKRIIEPEVPYTK